VDHRAWEVQALKPHGAASMGLRRFPGDKVGVALAAIDTSMFSHAVTSPAGYNLGRIVQPTHTVPR